MPTFAWGRWQPICRRLSRRNSIFATWKPIFLLDDVHSNLLEAFTTLRLPLRLSLPISLLASWNASRSPLPPSWRSWLPMCRISPLPNLIWRLLRHHILLLHNHLILLKYLLILCNYLALGRWILNAILHFLRLVLELNCIQILLLLFFVKDSLSISLHLCLSLISILLLVFAPELKLLLLSHFRGLLNQRIQISSAS